jgi:hypothetical protein
MYEDLRNPQLKEESEPTRRFLAGLPMRNQEPPQSSIYESLQRGIRTFSKQLNSKIKSYVISWRALEFEI